MASRALGLSVYRLATAAAAPLLGLLLKRRERQGKEDGARIGERWGHGSAPRPQGQLIWIHGASVGECLSVLPLMEALLEAPGRHVLLTSGTVTSARMMAKRLPPRAQHQYVPLDVPSAVRRFLDHWRPDMALFIDSEVWPNMLDQSHARGIPIALINGRMSERAFASWRRSPRMARAVLSLYDACLVQDGDTAERLKTLGARNVIVAGNLKADAPPLPADPGQLDALRKAVGNRPILLASQTHPGEEEIVLAAHDALKASHGDLLTIIVPRHPERGADIKASCGARASTQRSQAQAPVREIYIADTMGELGLFYRLTPFAFIGGSLVPHGGHNPLEPARLSCAVMSGQHTHNFAADYAALAAANALITANSAAEIARDAARLLQSPADARTLGERAARAAEALGGATDQTRQIIETLVGKNARA